MTKLNVKNNEAAIYGVGGLGEIGKKILMVSNFRMKLS